MRCSNCGRFIDAQENKMGDKYYCSTCFPTIQKEEKDRRALIGYICRIYGIPKPTGMMFGQMKRMRKKYTYKNMRLTLQFAFEVKNMKPNPDYGLAIIDYLHDDMISYYKNMIHKQKKTKGINYKDKKTVKITYKPTNKYKNKKLFDLDNL